MMRGLAGRREIRVVSTACVFIGLSGLLIAKPAIADETEWAQISKNDNLTIFARSHTGCPVKEIRAVGSIDAPNWVVRNVIDGVEDYPSFMPFTTKTQVIERKEHHLIGYFRLDCPFIGPRDITVEVSSQTAKRDDGSVVYQFRWEPANSLGPAPKPEITRITLDQGSWNLEPADGGKKTLAIYTIFTDGGGGLPPFVINFANRQAVENLFSAVRKQVGLPKYAQNRPGD